MIQPGVSLPDSGQLHNLWKTRQSQQEGFTRTYYTETPEGDELEVDFSFARRMVRICLRSASENGREYVSLIKGGTILQEREVAGKRSVDLTSRLSRFAQYFAFLPEAPVLEAIGGCYGLPEEPLFPAGRDRGGRGSDVLPITTRFSLLELIREYLAKKRDRARKERYAPWYSRLLRRMPAELTDLSVGLWLYWAYLQNMFGVTELAGYLGALGVFAGATDWLWRQRDPFLPKVMILMCASAVTVYWQIQYRMWGVFL